MTSLGDIRPTRSGLLLLRTRIRLAKRAHSILKMKLDGLILEVTRLAPQVKAEYELLNARYRRVGHLIAAAYMMEGTVAMTVAAYAVEVRPEIEITVKNRFGVKIPEITGKGIRTDLADRGYGLLGTTLVIDDLASAYEELTEAIVAYAGNEAALRRILDEIDRIGRRVRALEHQVIPALEETISKISRARDELEREESSRLFHVKKRRG